MSTMDFGNPGPAKTAASIARRLEIGDVLLRRWGGCWIDLIVLAAIILAPGLALPQGMIDQWIWVVFIPAILYFPVTEGLWGKSLGKLVTGMAVVDAKGKPPGIPRAIVRTLLRLFEVNPFLLGGIPAAICVGFNKERRRLGDLAAGTWVIHADDARRLAAQASQADQTATIFD